MRTGYKIRNIPTGTMSSTTYLSMTEATLALFDACPHSQSEFTVVPVQVCEHGETDFLSPCCYAPMKSWDSHCPTCKEPCEPQHWCYDCDEQIV